VGTNHNTARGAEPRIEQLLAELTLEEKVSLLGGASMWLTEPVERLGIPAIKVSDGPNGARGGGGFAGGAVTSACFPVGIALASTWNTALVEQIGVALAHETKSKGARFLLAPTVNIHRSPLNGRNFECYSEDPYLSARMAVAYIAGLQSQGVGATVKHFVCNDSEFERNSISSDVDERTMREIYLPPFQAAVQEAGSWAVMSSYNRVNGVFAGENAHILRDILKEEWGFDGLVMSDWFGTNSTVDAANNGLDLEMPGPPRYRGQKLLEAVRSGQVRMSAVDDSVRRLLRSIERVGAFENPEIAPERADDRPEHRALLRRAAAEGCVLLRNKAAALPLDLDKLASIAVIGPNARTAAIMGGGSAQVNAHYIVPPYDGIVARVDEAAEVGYEIGCTNHRQMPRVPARLLARGAHGAFKATYYNTLDLQGEPVARHSTTSSEQAWLGNVVEGVDPRAFSARLDARFTPDASGMHTFGLTSAGLSRLFIDDALVIDNWTQQDHGESYFGTGSTEKTAQLELEAGRTYAMRLEYSSQGTTLLAAVRLGYMPPVSADSIEHAVALAARSDVALVFVGSNGDWESEGFDRPDMELVGRQNELVERVAEANPNTIVVVQTGSPVTMPWFDKVAAVLQAWFPGQECGNAIADVLFGDVTPSGKLPQTFPVRLKDNPAYLNYPGEHGHVRYGEGIFVGYRYYEKKGVEPRFPFGFGLSYTTFVYGDLRLSADTLAPDGALTASIDITNTGERPGQEIVQLYVRDVAASVMRPEKELKGFAKLALQPGETGTATFSIGREALAFWDDSKHCWVAESGAFELLAGAASNDLRARARVELSASAEFGGPPRTATRYTLDTPIKVLLADPAAAAVIEQHLPGMTEKAAVAITMNLSLAQAADFTPEQLTSERLQVVAAALAALKGEA
jgi:beta-glucosidase